MRTRALVVPIVLAGLVVAELATATVPRPPVRFAVTVSRHRLTYRGSAATLTLTMRAGANAESVGVELDSSGWPESVVQGSPLSLTGQRVSGAGRITSIGVPSGGAQAPGESICQRGVRNPGGEWLAFALPARSTTRLSYDVRLGAPRWPGTSLTVSIVAGIPATANDPATQITQYQLGTQHFQTRGPSGVHITLQASARRTRQGQLHPVVRLGHTVLIEGDTSPALNRQPVQLDYASTTTSTHGRIGSVATDRDGRFSIGWIPRLAGTYTITAVYRHPARGLLADSACDLALTVK